MIAKTLEDIYSMKIFSPTRFIQDLILKQFKGSVLSGPFKDLKLVNEHVAAAGIPTILGTYEKELNSYFSKDFLKKYTLFIDIGAGEGYFVNGILKNNENLKCIAYEQNKFGQLLIKKNLILNGFESRATIKGNASPLLIQEELKLHTNETTILLIDVEGYEYEILCPDKYPELLQVDIIVEVHECFKPGLEELLTKRFLTTHNLKVVSAKRRVFSDFPITVPLWVRLLFKKYILHIMGEGRPTVMKWFIFTKQ